MLKLVPASVVLLLLASPALAQGTAISPGQSLGGSPGATGQSPPAAASAATSKAERTTKSKDCSAQADQQGLHGKARKRFRSECKAGKV